MSEKRQFHIKNRYNGEGIFGGYFKSQKACVEYAMAEKVDLRAASFSYFDLGHANLDGGNFEGVSFAGANLHGANLSECNLDHTDMAHADLTLACLAWSTLNNVNMLGASFGMTDFGDADMTACTISCPTFFNSNLNRVHIFDSCIYQGKNKTDYAMTRVPIVIQGLNAPVILLDEGALIQNRFIRYADIHEVSLQKLFTYDDNRIEQFIALVDAHSERHGKIFA